MFLNDLEHCGEFGMTKRRDLPSGDVTVMYTWLEPKTP
jgi:hypothetical protein